MKQGLRLRLYRTPKLVTKLKPGDIIEALPKSMATYTIFHGDVVKDSPTNVFGYVRGVVKSNFGVMGAGEFMVERVMPFGGVHMGDLVSRINGAYTWNHKSEDVYFLIGKLANLPRRTGYELKNLSGREKESEAIFQKNLLPGSITLPPDELGQLRDQLAVFIASRKNKDYIFSAGKKSYSLNDIIFSLQEKK